MIQQYFNGYIVVNEVVSVAVVPVEVVVVAAVVVVVVAIVVIVTRVSLLRYEKVINQNS